MRSLGRHPWITFTVIRLLLFVVPLVVAFALGANLALAAILAAVISLALSVIFLPKLRSAMATDIASRAGRKAPPTSDEEAEDIDEPVVDGPGGDATQTANTRANPTP